MPTDPNRRSRPTARQSEFLAFIRAFRERFGIAPSFDEIARHFMTSSPSVNGMIKTLEARGFLKRVPGVARSLEVIASTDRVAPTSKQRTEENTRNAQLQTAVHMAVAIVEQLIPALLDAEPAREHAAVAAVEMALEQACSDVRASLSDRRHARAALARAIALARATSLEAARDDPGLDSR